MTFYYLTRWTAGPAKVRGQTVRSGASDLTWEVVLVNDSDVEWYRLKRDLRDGEGSLAIRWDCDPQEAKSFLGGLDAGKTVTIEPGSFPNDSKNTTMYIRLEETGTATRDGKTRRLAMEKTKAKLEPREGREGQYTAENFSAAVALLDKKEAGVGLTPNVRAVPESDDTFFIQGFPVATVGTWNGVPITHDRLEQMVKVFSLLKDRLYVPLKLEHGGLPTKEGEPKDEGPALGWFKKLYISGKTLYGDLVKVPKAIVRLIKNGQYVGVSPEIARSFSGHPDTLVAVALLGAAMPAMSDLDRLMVMYNSADEIEMDQPLIPKSDFEEGGTVGTEEKKPVEEELEEKTVPEGNPEPEAVEEDVSAEEKTEQPEEVETFQNKEASETEQETKEESVEAEEEPVKEEQPVEEEPVETDEFGFPENIGTALFQRMENEKDKGDLVGALKKKKYPAPLAEEMLELMPSPNVDKLEAVPEYSIVMLEARLDILSDRSEMPERAEGVITELEETLDIFEEQLKENEELKSRIESILSTARENKGATELDEVEVPPTKDDYPSLEMPDTGEAESIDVLELQRMQQELVRRATTEKHHLLEIFRHNGFEQSQIEVLDQLVTHLDPVLTKEFKPTFAKKLLFQFLERTAPQIKTFQRIVSEEHSPNVEFSEMLLSHSRQGRRKN